MVQCVSEIVAELIRLHENNQAINLDKIKTTISAQYGLSEQPKTVDIIAAIPEEYKNFLLPVLKSKPVRTASGVNPFFSFFKNEGDFFLN